MINPIDVIQILDSIPDEKMNPIVFGDNGPCCVYTANDGSHCIVGEIVSKLGFDLPDADDDVNYLPVNRLIRNMGYGDDFSKEAIDILMVAQNIADIYTTNNDINAWAFAKQAMTDNYNSINEV